MADKVIAGPRNRTVDLVSGDSLTVLPAGALEVSGLGFAVDGRGDGIAVSVDGVVESESSVAVALQGADADLAIATEGVLRSLGVAPTGPAPLGGVFVAVLAGDRFRLDNAGDAVGLDGVDLSGADGVGVNSGLIEALGDFEGTGIALRLQGTGSSFDNSGTIRSVDLGVLLGGSGSAALQFTNSGLIRGDTAASIAGGDGHRFVNTGVIEGWHDGILGDGLSFQINSAKFRLDNQGTIVGDINAGDGWQIIRNDGTIDGDVYLGAGTDVFFGTGDMGNAPGETTNGVRGQGGNDRLYGGASTNFLTGDGGDDQIQGGAVGDQLMGGNGDDRIDGKGGWETLYGGAGADLFVFAPGHGTDLIEDFERRVDLIDLTAFGFADFDDMRALTRIYVGRGERVILDLQDVDGGRIVLRGILTVSEVTEDFFSL